VIRPFHPAADASREWATRRGFEVVRRSVGNAVDLADGPAMQALNQRLGDQPATSLWHLDRSA